MKRNHLGLIAQIALIWATWKSTFLDLGGSLTNKKHPEPPLSWPDSSPSSVCASALVFSAGSIFLCLRTSRTAYASDDIPVPLSSQIHNLLDLSYLYRRNPSYKCCHFLSQKIFDLLHPLQHLVHDLLDFYQHSLRWHHLLLDQILLLLFLQLKPKTRSWFNSAGVLFLPKSFRLSIGISRPTGDIFWDLEYSRHFYSC